MAWSVQPKYKDICIGANQTSTDFKINIAGASSNADSGSVGLKQLQEEHFCRDIDSQPSDGKFQASERKFAAAMLYDSRWDQFQILKIRFLNGEVADHKWVQDVVTRTYTADLMNLKLQWVTEGPAEIRITIGPGGSWSLLGKQCLTVPQDKPTMNLGWLDKPATDKEQLDGGVIKHEFGHCLGPWIHEHQNPKGSPIQWNVPVVVLSLRGPPNKWSDKEICENIFPKYSQDQLRSTDYDKDSIMQYFYPASWVESKQGTSVKQQLSLHDKQFLRHTYPPDGKKMASAQLTPSDKADYVITKQKGKINIHFKLTISAVILVIGVILTGSVAFIVYRRCR
jgi:hypothetical protein